MSQWVGRVWRRAVREGVEGLEGGRGGGALGGVGMVLGWSVVMMLRIESMHWSVALMIASLLLSAKEVWSRERADLPRRVSPTIWLGSSAVSTPRILCINIS